MIRWLALGLTAFSLMGFYCGFDDKQIYAWGYDDGKCMGFVDAEMVLLNYAPTKAFDDIKELADRVCAKGSVDLGAKTKRGGQ